MEIWEFESPSRKLTTYRIANKELIMVQPIRILRDEYAMENGFAS